eukprot:Nk52_evm2s639 gene=Nk52_evmTU2s639
MCGRMIHLGVFNGAISAAYSTYPRVLNRIMDTRCFSSLSRKCISQIGNNSSVNIFDRQTKRHQKNVAASIALRENDASCFDYIKDEVAERVADRLDDIKRDFPVLLDLGAHSGSLAKFVDGEKIGKLIQCDISEANLLRDSPEGYEILPSRVCADEEFIPFAENSLDGVVSNLSLHWVNDLPGCLSQIKTALKPDGFFIGAIFGGETLFELRCSLQLAEMERLGGFRPHISPFSEVRDVGNLLSRAGFTMTTIDMDSIIVNYPSMFELMADLKGMGETNAAWSRNMLTKDVLASASAIYQHVYGNEDGHIPATFNVIYLIGWKPDRKSFSKKSKKAAASGGSVTGGREETNGNKS